jgi:ABC-type uncharacterized transport system ATPase component
MSKYIANIDEFSREALMNRVVRYADLIPCYNAFIDCRTPGSEAKENFTIIIVTHSMQQAARVSTMTAFFNMGKIVEYDATDKIFTNPSKQQTQDYITGRFG